MAEDKFEAKRKIGGYFIPKSLTKSQLKSKRMQDYFRKSKNKKFVDVMPKIGETPKFRDLMERLKERRKDKQYRKRKKLKSMPFKNTLPSMEQRNKSAPVGWEIDPATDRLRKKK